MKRYIVSDLKRIAKRVPRWILAGLTLIVPVVICLVIMLTAKEPTTGSSYATIAKTALSLCIMLFGLYEIVYVYGDDFKAKSMQIAIGSGISRPRVVTSKWLLVMILVAADTFVLTILLTIVGAIFSAGFAMTDFAGMLYCGSGTWLMTVAIIGLASIVMFAAQAIGLGVLLYLAVQCGLIEQILDLITSIAKLEKLHLSSYELYSMCELFEARLELGNIHFASLIGIIIYMAASFLLSITVFKHKELEF